MTEKIEKTIIKTSLKLIQPFCYLRSIQ